jgi:hypothetical protein
VVRHAQGLSYGHLVAGSSAWTDYTLSAEVRPTSLTTGFAGVAARYMDDRDYYACGVYYASAFRLWRVRAGSVRLLDARAQPVDPNRFHSVRLVARGGWLSCVLDGTLMVSAADDSFKSGKISLVAGDDEAAEFGQVNVAL